MYNFGIIGNGDVVKNRHLPAIYELEGNVLDICDSHHDYKNILKNKYINVVVIATPNYLHIPMAIEALKTNKRIILEKPLATTNKDAIRLINTFGSNKIAICYQRRFDTQALEIKNYPFSIKKINCEMIVKRDSEYWNTWRSNKNKSGGGALKNIFIHYFDLIQWWCGSKYRIVFSRIANRINIDQVIYTELMFGDIPVTFFGSSIHSRRQNCVTVTFSDGKVITYDKEDATHFNVYDQFLNHYHYVSPSEAFPSLKIVSDIYQYDKENS